MRYLVVFVALLAMLPAAASEYSYESVAKRYGGGLAAGEVKAARMQGECLVGLKQLNFRKRDKLDPIAEWTTYRSISLLEQFPPCTVLIMMEVARETLIVTEAASSE